MLFGSTFSVSILFLRLVWIGVYGCLRTAPKTSFDLIEGSSVTLSCFTSCGNVVWLLNGIIEPSITESYRTVYLDSTRTGVYECAAERDRNLTERAWVANITVGCIIAPVEQYALIGKSAKLNCSVTVNGAQIYWYSYEDPSVNGSVAVSISAVSLRDDHAFICSVVQHMVNVLRTVHLNVLAPPTIRSGPSAVIEFVSNDTRTVPVSFHSRPAHTTTISWYKNGYHIFNATNTTTVLGALEGSTSLLLLPPLIRREDGGVYTVVITNSFSEIPIDMRNSSISFELKVKVPPFTPVDIRISSANSSIATVTWSMYPRFPDEDAATFTLVVQRSDGGVASMLHLDGGSRRADLRVSPGVGYELRITATNADGSVTTQPVHFFTPPEATSVLSAVIYRVNFTVFLLTVNLSYNGGVGAEDLNISYRAADTGAHWSPAPTIRITSTSMLSVSAVVELPQPDASAGRMEFKMSVMDAGSFETTPLLFTERVDLPGPPRLSIAKASTNLTVNVHLSEVGSPPLVQVVLIVATLGSHYLLTTDGLYLPGGCVTFTLSGLTNHGGGGYVFEAYAVNYAGQGPTSPQATYPDSTGVPLWVVMTSALGAVIFCTLVGMVWLGCARCIGAKQKSYAVSEDSISTSVRMCPPQSSSHGTLPSPDCCDTKAFLAAINSSADTSPTDTSIQFQCHEPCPIEHSKAGLTDGSFSDHSSQRIMYATYV